MERRSSISPQNALKHLQDLNSSDSGDEECSQSDMSDPEFVMIEEQSDTSGSDEIDVEYDEAELQQHQDSGGPDERIKHSKKVEPSETVFMAEEEKDEETHTGEEKQI